jgi:hypothetical protein
VSVVQPTSFSDELWDAWGRWVLGHGLPPVPTEIGLDESIPVSYWRGDQYAAVLYVHRFFRTRPDELPADEEWDEEERTDLDVELFRRIDHAWETYGGGGANWHSDRSLTRPAMDPRAMDLGGMYGSFSGDKGCVGVYGYLGTDVATLELEQGGAVDRRAVVAPLGAAVVAARGDIPFTIRGLAQDGSLIAEIEETARSLADFREGR